MRKENIEKIVKFVGKLDAQYHASLRKSSDSNIITLIVEYYENHFEGRPCSGDIRNGITEIMSVIKFVETKKGLKIVSANVKSSTPCPSSNWNGWTTTNKDITKPTWSSIKREHNKILEDDVYNELYNVKGFIDRLICETEKASYCCTIGARYDAYVDLDSIIRIKEAV